jgi:glutamate synthase domain-containing protein 3
MSFAAGMEIGNVFVQTTSNRGYTAEEIAERAVNRLRRIETEEELKRVLTKYLQEAQDSERMNARRTLIENGFIDAASHLGD